MRDIADVLVTSFVGIAGTALVGCGAYEIYAPLGKVSVGIVMLGFVALSLMRR